MRDKTKSAFEHIALLLQGGGALGAYQGGVFEALCEAGLEPDWMAGISIGAINAAILAGNSEKDRVQKLRQFWEGVTTDDFQFLPPMVQGLFERDSSEHQMFNAASAWRTLVMGVPSFFDVRLVSPWIAPVGSVNATSFYDTSPLRARLEELIDFDRINHSDIRLTLGAVNVTTGNFTSFDNHNGAVITVDHVMASGALPPGFAPVKIGDCYFWDGGLVSNTPLQWLLQEMPEHDTLIFQIDLWSADGELPRNIAEVYTRQKDIQYSSRTRTATDEFRNRHRMGYNIAKLLEKVPQEVRDLPEMQMLAENAETNKYNIVHLIYHNKSYEGYSKDFEFSRMSMDAHWRAGYNDTAKALSNPEILQRPSNAEGIGIFDFSQKRDNIV